MDGRREYANAQARLGWTCATCGLHDGRQRNERSTAITTFMLIHGAYQGGWVWEPVATLLRGAGHVVLAPSLDGCGERSDELRAGITTESQAQEVAIFLEQEDLVDVVLVGTSVGGMVAAKVAELQRSRIGRLVFIDALALFDGERISDVVTPVATITTDTARGVSPEARAKLLSELEPETAGWAADRFGLHPLAVFTEPVELPQFWDQTWDASVIYCRQAHNPGEAHQRRCAEKLDATWHEMDTGHYPMLSAPDELVELLVLRSTF
ncbi:MAG: alpha/beta fold hydrolase [Acidimicrobiales bacterium]